MSHFASASSSSSSSSFAAAPPLDPLDPVSPALLVDVYPVPRCAIHTVEFGTLTLSAKTPPALPVGGGGGRGGGSGPPNLVGEYLAGGPDVRTLSALIPPPTTVHSNESKRAKREEEEKHACSWSSSRSVPLLASEPSSSSKDNKDGGEDADGEYGGDDDVRHATKLAELRCVVSEMGGFECLAERLSDAAAASPAISSSSAAFGADHTAAAASSSSTSPKPGDTSATGDMGELENFLVRSEAVIAEFLSAVSQHRRSEGNKGRGRGRGRGRKRRRGTTGATGDDYSSSSSLDLLPPSYFSALSSQLSTLEVMEGVRSVDLTDDLLRVTVGCSDGKGREHELRAELNPSSFPSSSPVFITELPADFEYEWVRPSPPGRSAEGGSGTNRRENVVEDDDDGNSAAVAAHEPSSFRCGLPAAYSAFRSALSSHAILWDELDDLDENAWVLDPPLPPARSSVERRIALRTGLSVVLTLDVENPRGVPAGMRLVGGGGGGGGDTVSELRGRWRGFVEEEDDDDHRESKGTQRDRWDPSRSIRSNLESWLGSSLPSPATANNKSDYVAECGICYSHRLPAAAPPSSAEGGGAGGTPTTVPQQQQQSKSLLPDEVCPNPTCARSYHESCLFEWLHRLPSARVGFDRVYGTCPYCCGAISVRVAQAAAGGSGSGGMA